MLDKKLHCTKYLYTYLHYTKYKYTLTSNNCFAICTCTFKNKIDGSFSLVRKKMV